MAEAFIDIQIIEDVFLPYEAGAEAWLDDTLRPAWDALVAAFPDLRLDPLFASVEPTTLADMMDAARMLGSEPQDPFCWFEIPCDDVVGETLLPLIAALPFIRWAGIRRSTVAAGVISFGTNPEANNAMQLEPGPFGVDAKYAWQVAGGTAPGIRVCDVEGGWNLDHEDLIGSQVTRWSTFGSDDTDHGTAVLGILLGADNGVGLVGIAPEANGFVVSTLRANGVDSIAAALVAAGLAVQTGGVVLIEQAMNFVLNQSHPDILVEFDRPVQVAIDLLTSMGINVVEPAGNGGQNFDAFAFMRHVQRDKPEFVDSGAIVVGGADLVSVEGADDVAWSRGSSYGNRVDCFAAFGGIRAPADNPVTPYQSFGGTSGASAIIAGVVCTLQGMSQAANGWWLWPDDIRRLLSDPALGTPTGTGVNIRGGIGTMPDLRKIANYMGWARILPPAALAFADDGFTIVTLDNNDALIRRNWTRVLGLEPALGFNPLDEPFHLSQHTPAPITTLTLEPEPKTLFEVLTTGNGGAVHYYWWDTLGDSGHLAFSKTPEQTVAAGHDLAAVRTTEDLLVVAAIDPQGRLIVMTEDTSIIGLDGLSPPQVIDDGARYRTLSGPVLLCRLPTTMDVIGIDDGGDLRWIAGTTLATIGTGWQPPFIAPGNVPLNPRAKPGVVGTMDGIAAVAVGFDGLLYACGFGLAPMMFDMVTPIDASIQFAAQGPVGLALGHDNVLAAAAVGIDGLVYAAFRPLTFGGNWTALVRISDIVVSPLGGASVIRRGPSLSILAVQPDGRPCRFDLTDTGEWSSAIG